MNNSFSVKVERFLQRISKQEKKNQTMEIFLLSVVFTFSPAIKQIIQFLCGFVFLCFLQTAMNVHGAWETCCGKQLLH